MKHFTISMLKSIFFIFCFMVLAVKVNAQHGNPDDRYDPCNPGAGQGPGGGDPGGGGGGGNEDCDAGKCAEDYCDFQPGGINGCHTVSFLETQLPLSSGNNSQPGIIWDLAYNMTQQEHQPPFNYIEITIELKNVSSYAGNCTNGGIVDQCADMCFDMDWLGSQQEWVAVGTPDACGRFTAIKTAVAVLSISSAGANAIKIAVYDGAATGEVNVQAQDFPDITLLIPPDYDEDGLADEYERNIYFYESVFGLGYVEADPCNPLTIPGIWDGANDTEPDYRTAQNGGPVGSFFHDALGDGFTQWEEYRGFLVQGSYTRHFGNVPTEGDPVDEFAKILFVVDQNNNVPGFSGVTIKKIRQEIGAQPVVITQGEMSAVPAEIMAFVPPDPQHPFGQIVTVTDLGKTINFNHFRPAPNAIVHPSFPGAVLINNHQACVLIRNPIGAGENAFLPSGSLAASLSPQVNDELQVAPTGEVVMVSTPILFDDADIGTTVAFFQANIQNFDVVEYKHGILIHEMTHKVAGNDGHSEKTITRARDAQNQPIVVADIASFVVSQMTQPGGPDKDHYWKFINLPIPGYPEAFAVFYATEMVKSVPENGYWGVQVLGPQKTFYQLENLIGSTQPWNPISPIDVAYISAQYHSPAPPALPLPDQRAWVLVFFDASTNFTANIKINDAQVSFVDGTNQGPGYSDVSISALYPQNMTQNASHYQNVDIAKQP